MKLLQYLQQNDECIYRNADLAYTYGPYIHRAQHNLLADEGARYIGIDFHRFNICNTSIFPTAKELEKMGIKRVVFLDESIPENLQA